MAETVTITGPCWVLASDQSYDAREGKEIDNYKDTRWYYIMAGEKATAEIVNGHYYKFRPYYYDDASNLYCAALMFLDSNNNNTIEFFEEEWFPMLEKGYLSNDDPFNIKLPASLVAYNNDYNRSAALADRTVPEEGINKGKVVGHYTQYGKEIEFPLPSPVVFGLYSSVIRYPELRFQIDDSPTYYRATSKWFYVDPDQSDTPAPRSSTECPKTTITNKAVTSDGKNKSTSFGYADRDANSDAFVSFAAKYNALSQNTPAALIHTNKRSLHESFKKEDPLFGAATVVNTSQENVSKTKIDVITITTNVSYKQWQFDETHSTPNASNVHLVKAILRETGEDITAYLTKWNPLYIGKWQVQQMNYTTFNLDVLKEVDGTSFDSPGDYDEDYPADNWAGGYWWMFVDNGVIQTEPHPQWKPPDYQESPEFYLNDTALKNFVAQTERGKHNTLHIDMTLALEESLMYKAAQVSMTYEFEIKTTD